MKFKNIEKYNINTKYENITYEEYEKNSNKKEFYRDTYNFYKILEEKTLNPDRSRVRSFNSIKKLKYPQVREYPRYSYIEWELELTWFNYINKYIDPMLEILTKKDRDTIGYYSDSGSIYWYSNQYIYRLSNHWGDVASCYWPLYQNNIEIEVYPNNLYLGKARWEDIEYIDPDDRDPYYLYREQPEAIKQKLIEKGLVSMMDFCGDIEYRVECDYSTLAEFLK